MKEVQAVVFYVNYINHLLTLIRKPISPHSLQKQKFNTSTNLYTHNYGKSKTQFKIMCGRIYTVYTCCDTKNMIDLFLCPDGYKRDREPCDEVDSAKWKLPSDKMCRACWKKL